MGKVPVMEWWLDPLQRLQLPDEPGAAAGRPRD
jgi:hypothetical protein